MNEGHWWYNFRDGGARKEATTATSHLCVSVSGQFHVVDADFLFLAVAFEVDIFSSFNLEIKYTIYNLSTTFVC